MLACQRDLFEIPRDLTYLNAAYMGPLSRDVLHAAREGLERKVRPWQIRSPDFFEPVDELRDLFAELINGDPDGVAVVPAVSYGVSLAAGNLPLNAGQQIVILAEEFPSNVYAWHELAAQREAEVIVVGRPPDHDWTKAVLDKMDERTAILSLSQCHWIDGGSVDLVAVASRAREIGAALVVDGTQSIGAMSFDAELIRPDFVITALYKWLLAPYGGALMWCAPSRREGRPLEESWITRRGSRDFAHLIDYRRQYRAGARRYDVGETANFALIPAFSAAIRQTLRWGVAEISSYLRQLTDLVAAGAVERGLGVAPQPYRGPNLLGVHLPGVRAENIARALASSDVHVSVRGDAIRVSPHVYNDAGDIERLFEALDIAL